MNWNQQFSNGSGFPDEATPLGVKDAKLHPQNCCGLIFCLRNGVPVVSTGFLIAGNLVLTAAHNIYEGGVASTAIKFYPGVTNSFSIAEGYDVVDYRFPPQFKQTEKAPFDYALLKLKSRVHRSEYIQLGVDYQQQSEEIGIIGYRAATTKLGTTEIESKQFLQWKRNVHQVNNDNTLLLHKLSTFGGNSGSSLLVKRQGKCIAVGIHKDYGNSISKNVARMITKQVLVDLLKWQRQMTPSQIDFTFMTKNPKFLNPKEKDQWYQSVSKKIAATIESFKNLKSQNQQQFSKNNIKITQLQPMKIQQRSLDEVNKRLKAMSVKQKQTITSLTIITVVPLLQSKGKGFITQKQSIRKIEQKALDLEVKLQICSVNVGRSKKQTAIEEGQRSKYLRSTPVWMKYIKAQEEYQKQMGKECKNSRKSKIKSIKSKFEVKKKQLQNNEEYNEYQ